MVPRPSWQDISSTNVDSSNAINASDSDVTVAIAVDLWRESIDRGTKLTTGMKSDDATAATLYGFLTDTAESPFDGSLIEELREWGHMLSKTFAALGMGTASKGAEGPNECFQFEHYGGPTTIKNSDGTLPEKRE
ncbi:Mitochondrial import inner membrane translocase subunit tim8 [Didymella sp. IMI 355093]|nr:Mitochondrial import inner membrane translocase subunit tim8 [Didymella sp. IMI 355093]